MDDCLSWFVSPATSQSSKREAIVRKLLDEVRLRQDDVTHAHLAVEIAEEKVRTTYASHGHTSTQLESCVNRLTRERVREQACAKILKQLEDAQHMMLMKDMTVSALATLRLTGLGANNNQLDTLLDIADTELSLVDEARQQVDEISNCFSLESRPVHVDDVLKSLGIDLPETSVTIGRPQVATNGPAAPAAQHAPVLQPDTTSIQSQQVSKTTTPQMQSAEPVI